jgi:hypothetical protein
MVYIVATKLRKAIELGATLSADNDTAWQQLILTPYDYSKEAIVNPVVRILVAGPILHCLAIRWLCVFDVA